MEIKTNFFLVSIFLLIGQNVLSQTPSFDWAIKSGSTGSDWATAVVTDNSGNIYTTGSFQGTVDFDPGAGIFNMTAIAGTQLDDAFVTKLDANGNFIWAKQFSGTGYENGVDLTLDNSGNLCVIGDFEGTVDFDPSAGTQNLTATISIASFILKLDAYGNFIWVKQIEGTMMSIYTDDSGNLLSTGTFMTTVDVDPSMSVLDLIPAGSVDSFVLKLDQDGLLIWVKQIGNSSGSINSLTVCSDNSGNVFFGGQFNNTVDFNPNVGTFNLSSVSGSQDIFICKLDAIGNFVWAIQVGSTSIDRVRALRIDADQNLIATGWFHGTADFNSGAGTHNLTAPGINVNCFVMKLDNGGNFVWAKSIQSNQFNGGVSVDIDNSNHIYVAGTFEGTADFDTGASTENHTSFGSDDSFILKLDDAGTFVWMQQIGGTSYDGITEMTIDINNNIISAGYFDGTCDFDPTVSSFNLSSAGTLEELFVMKLSQCNNDVTNPVADVLTLSDITSQCPVTSLTAPTATDNCAGTINGTHNATLPITIQGTTVVTWTYDDGNGNSITQNQNVIIDDNTNPVADVVTLSDITSQCSITSLTAPTATDNCAGTISGTHNAALPISTQGTTIVIWTYDDGNGNMITQNQNVIIDDNTNPVADVVALAAITSQCSVTSLTAPTATDNCAGSINGTHNATLPITTQGTTIVIWTYDDGNGNSITQNQNVIIDDNTNPITDVLTLSDITSECSIASLSAPTATDNCSGALTGTHNATLPITASGTTVITWTYDDGNGNTITQNQNIIITPIDNSVSANALTLTANASGYSYQWIDCGNGNAPISGETNQSFTATTNGIYAVEISNGTCTVTSTCTAITQVGLNENSLGQVTIYPNPFVDYVMINSSETIQEIQVTNNAGQIVQTTFVLSEDGRVELNDLAAGIYFIRVKTENGQSVYLIIKE